MFVEKGKTAVEEFDLPAPGPTQVVLQTITSVISPGTELAYLHQLENARWPLPGPSNGYCACGVVAARGADVKEPEVGRRVVAMMPHASHGLVEAAACHPIADSLAPGEAATFTLGGISLQAVRKGEVRLGQTVAVIGLGVIGNYAGQLARAAGASLVVGIDPVAWRRDLATKCGFDAVAESAAAAPVDRFHQLKKAGGFDVVIEATGAPAPIIDAFRLARRLGRVVLLGSTRGITEKVDFYNDVHRKGLTIVGAHNGARPAVDDIGAWFTWTTDANTMLDLLTARRVNAGPLLTETVKAAEAPRAYERLADRNNPLMTVALDWT
jgi:threonine dehydrogenase-like Zn-dependent dehydrogenase